MVFTEKEKIVFFTFAFYSLHANARFWRHKLRRQTKYVRQGVDVQSLTCEALER